MSQIGWPECLAGHGWGRGLVQFIDGLGVVSGMQAERLVWRSGSATPTAGAAGRGIERECDAVCALQLRRLGGVLDSWSTVPMLYARTQKWNAKKFQNW